LFLMRKYIGDIDNQILCSTVFAKYIASFVIEETNHLSDNQIDDMRYSAKKILIDLRNGYISE
ncbi:MAG: hypothetical protein WC629_01450, partial [Candidatus Paceibacterota bacterium]